MEAQPVGSEFPLRVLIVEDSEDDAALLLRELKRGFPGVQARRVDTPAAMRSALEEDQWDLVVADFHMPHFSAPAAIELLQSTALDSPLIIVSGSVGEETAVESLRAGARDFLLKGSFKRLLPAIERELAQTEQRRARRLADERNRLLAAIVESSADAIISTDLEGNVATWNRGAQRMYGYEAREMIGMHFSRLEPEGRQGEIAGFLSELDAGAALRRYETTRRRKDGTSIEVAVTLFPIRDATGLMVGAASVARDITDRKRSEAALRSSEARYRLLFENNPQPMWVIDDETQAFVAVNAAASAYYGYSSEEFLAMTLRDLIAEEAPLGSLVDDVYASSPSFARSSGPPIRQHRKKDGSIVDSEIASHPFVFDGRPAQLMLAKDVTQHRMLELQLRQSQKMEAVGRLAGGIAHDFNNVLTAILGYADLLGGEVAGDDATSEYVREIAAAGERAASLTRQLLAFSRQQMLEPRVLDLNALVENLQKMLRRLIGEDVELVTVLSERLPHVQADPGQLEQVIMNLAVNSRDAMPRGGTLTIETAEVELDPSYNKEHFAMPPGKYVMLAVTDSGIGMSAETRSHMFEPFFTTKELGKGTGLGLATVYGIVKQSGGFVWVYSELGIGTTFKIYLPPVEAPVDRSVRPKNGVVGGHETILLVEDEPGVRQLARKILERLGYRVLSASGGIEAIQIFMTATDPIDLLLTDVVMPDMSGSDIVAQIQRLSPRTKTVYMSGYTDDAIVRHGLIDPAQHFLQKPFSPEALGVKIREVLDSARETA
jgi:two-component system, cell cycle sensor histidine kinase and response regulator CckA